MGLHCDLAERPELRSGKLGLLVAHDHANLDHLVNLITTWDYVFRVDREVAVVWVLPNLPDFINYNGDKVQRFQKRLNYLQREGCYKSEERFAANLHKLATELSKFDLHTVELEQCYPNLLREESCDGVHLPHKKRKAITRRLIDAALDLLPLRKPKAVKTRTLKAQTQRQNHKKRGQMRQAAHQEAEEIRTKQKAGRDLTELADLQAQVAGGSRRKSIIVHPEQAN